MSEQNDKSVNLNMPFFIKFMSYKLPIIIGIYMPIILFGLVLINGIETKNSIKNILEVGLSLPIFLIIIGLLLFKKVRNARFAAEMSIDKENKEFRAYIYDSRKEIRFGIDNLTEVGSSNEMFRFYLKDGTWFSWAKGGTSQQSLEEIIKSFGLSITSKRLW